MNTENNLSAKEFIQKALIKEIAKLINHESYHFAFVIMVQGLETLGGFLDNKPLKAKDQSKLRFSHAINRLMPQEYAKFNNNHVLYNMLRASLAHTLTTSRLVFLTTKNHAGYGEKHLQKIDDKLILVCEDFYDDFTKACKRLVEAMDKGIISAKKINSEFYYTF